jgi:hypothetical protein
MNHMNGLWLTWTNHLSGSCHPHKPFIWFISITLAIHLVHVNLTNHSPGSCQPHNPFTWFMSTTQTIHLAHVNHTNHSSGSCQWLVCLRWTRWMVCVVDMNQVNGLCGWYEPGGQPHNPFTWFMSTTQAIHLVHVSLTHHSPGSCQPHKPLKWFMSTTQTIHLVHVNHTSHSSGSCQSRKLYFWFRWMDCVVDMNHFNGLCGWHEPDEWFVWVKWTRWMVCVVDIWFMSITQTILLVHINHKKTIHLVPLNRTNVHLIHVIPTNHSPGSCQPHKPFIWFMSITQTIILVHINHKRNPVIWFISMTWTRWMACVVDMN